MLIFLVKNIEKPEFEIPIQLAIVNEVDPYQIKLKTGITSTFTAEDVNRTPITLSLFPEYFDTPDDETISSTDMAAQYF